MEHRLSNQNHSCCDQGNHKEQEHKHHHGMHAMHSDHDHGHDHSGGMMSHGSVKGFLYRFFAVTILLIPLALSNPALAKFLGVSGFIVNQWISFSLAVVIFSFSLIFFRHAWHEIKSKQYGMMTLVSLAVFSGFGFSVVATFIPSIQADFYLEISTLIWVLLFGHFLEAKSSNLSSSALGEVAKLLPKKAHKIIEGGVKDFLLEDLKIGDLVLVKAGESVPADGKIKEGRANVDESLISGESKPVSKKVDDNVVAGSICLDGSLTIILSKVGEDSMIGQIKKLIEEAGRTKPRSQKIADKASGVLTFVALGVSILTFLIWFFVVGQSLVFALTLAITVLVIACPHALGLAIPTVTTIATTLSVKNGLFIKDLSKIEQIKDIDYIVFDKTGTLTTGKFGVSKVGSFSEKLEDEILAIVGSLEQHSSHVIAGAILGFLKTKEINLSAINNFKDLAGLGVEAEISGKKYFAGNQKLMNSLGLNKNLSKSEKSGTEIYLADESNILGMVELSDSIKESAISTIKVLHQFGIKTAMITGDNEKVASEVAETLGIDKFFAGVLPEDKYKYIKDLQEKGNKVIMIGDGVNDAPALTVADVGVAIGAGTDVAVSAGDVVLTRNNLVDIVSLIKLSRAVYSKMVQNLAWAFGYNIIAIPLASGVLISFGILLRPEIGALVMSFSTVIVVLNSLTLRKIKFR